MARKRKGQRSHKPKALGPRVEKRPKRAQYWTVDGRPWGRSRYHALRKPGSPGWPLKGAQTTDEREAVEWARAYQKEWESEDATGRGSATETVTLLDDVLLAYYRELENEVLPETYIKNVSVLNSRFAPWLKKQKRNTTAGLSGNDLRAFAFALMREGLADSTVRHSYVWIVSRFLRWAGVPHPTEGLELREEGEREPHYFSDDELAHIHGVCTDAERLLVDVALATGARQAELCALRAEKFAFEPEWTVSVVAQVDRFRRLVPTKGKNLRTVALLRSASDLAPRLPKRGFVFAHADGGPIGVQTIRRRFKAIYERAGIDERGLAAHVWRHTYARIFLQETGGDIGLLHKSLGNTFKTAESYYDNLGRNNAALLASAKMRGLARPRLV